MTRLPLRSDWVSLWLWAVAAMVILMILVGGATRLTDSGLSITQWQPVTGIIPPLNEADWLKEFDKYQQIPEYKLVNSAMTLDEFKVIYGWEWGHRLLGRLIGVAFVLPMAIFLFRNEVPSRIIPRLYVLLGLGGLQGFIGWWMVKSGLSERIDVAPERLMIHLGMAFILLGALIWTALETSEGEGRGRYVPLNWRVAVGSLWGLVFLQIIIGALVAGNDAGKVYTDWPLMNGYFVPYFDLKPGLYALIFHDQGFVQFIHRMNGYVLVAFAIFFAYQLTRVCRDERITTVGKLLAYAIVAQAVLGIVTLQLVSMLWISLIHQLGASLLFGLATYLVWKIYRADRAF